MTPQRVAHPNSRQDNWRREAATAAAARQRTQRIEKGEQSRKDEAAWTARHYTQQELILPILSVLEESGGARPIEIYERIADATGLDEEARIEAKSFQDGQTSNLFHRTMRWALQETKRQNLATTSERGRWKVTEHGTETLGLVEPGIRITIFTTKAGVAIAALAEEAASMVDPGSLNLLFTSPVFPLLKPKSYGSIDVKNWLPWMLDLVAQWIPLLSEDGSIVMHLGDVHHRGMPATSHYIERFGIALSDQLGLYRMQPHYWHNPTRAPEMEHCAKRRTFVRNGVEPLLWYSRSPIPKANNARVLKPYTDSGKKRLGRTGTPALRPSGYDMGPQSWSRDNGGSIPTNIITASSGGGNDPYRRSCRAHGLPSHPAVMPLAVPTHFIKLTTEPGDLVGDFFAGSGSTAAAAEQLGRRWIAIDRSRVYLEGASHRPQFTEPQFRLD